MQVRGVIVRRDGPEKQPLPTNCQPESRDNRTTSLVGALPRRLVRAAATTRRRPPLRQCDQLSQACFVVRTATVESVIELITDHGHDHVKRFVPAVPESAKPAGGGQRLRRPVLPDSRGDDLVHRNVKLRVDGRLRARSHLGRSRTQRRTPGAPPGWLHAARLHHRGRATYDRRRLRCQPDSRKATRAARRSTWADPS